MFIPQRELCYTSVIVTIRFCITLTILTLLFSVTPSDTAELFRWEDEQGVVHFTDNQHNIPKQYMDRVERIKSPAPSKAPENPLFPQKVSIPLKAIGSAAVVQVKLNDRATGNFIVDTGASYTVISRATARTLSINLKKNVKNVRLQTANGLIDAPLVKLDSIEVGGMRIGNLMAAVHDFSQDESVSGLLGLNFLSHFRIDIDTKNRVLVLEKK
jgi:aspartyl protease family protein